MSMNDLLSDMLTRIRNGQSAKLARVQCPFSNLLKNVLNVLKNEGFISDFSETENDGKKFLHIDLKYFQGNPVIQVIKRVSTPGRRVYNSVSQFKPFHNGLGVVILSTSKGVLSDKEARLQNVGGEVLCNIF